MIGTVQKQAERPKYGVEINSAYSRMCRESVNPSENGDESILRRHLDTGKQNEFEMSMHSEGRPHE